VTDLARKMVCEWGMSQRLGPIRFGSREELIFLGKEISQQKDYSEQTARAIDEEVHRMVSEAFERAMTILQEKIGMLHTLAAALLEREILDGEEVGCILRGEKDPSECRTHPAPGDGGTPGEALPGAAAPEASTP
jgi:cell division protease FtsH